MSMEWPVKRSSPFQGSLEPGKRARLDSAPLGAHLAAASTHVAPTGRQSAYAALQPPGKDASLKLAYVSRRALDAFHRAQLPEAALPQEFRFFLESCEWCRPPAGLREVLSLVAEHQQQTNLFAQKAADAVQRAKRSFGKVDAETWQKQRQLFVHFGHLVWSANSIQGVPLSIAPSLLGATRAADLAGAGFESEMLFLSRCLQSGLVETYKQADGSNWLRGKAKGQMQSTDQALRPPQRNDTSSSTASASPPPMPMMTAGASDRSPRSSPVQRKLSEGTTYLLSVLRMAGATHDAPKTRTELAEAATPAGIDLIKEMCGQARLRDCLQEALEQDLVIFDEQKEAWGLVPERQAISPISLSPRLSPSKQRSVLEEDTPVEADKSVASAKPGGEPSLTVAATVATLEKHEVLMSMVEAVRKSTSQQIEGSELREMFSEEQQRRMLAISGSLFWLSLCDWAVLKGYLKVVDGYTHE